MLTRIQTNPYSNEQLNQSIRLALYYRSAICQGNTITKAPFSPSF